MLMLTFLYKAGLIIVMRCFEHLATVLQNDLHWFPIEQRVAYKIAFFIYKCCHGSAPSYLALYCTTFTTATQHHQLCSTTWDDLHHPRKQTYHFGPRSFHVSGHAVWNLLPIAIRDSSLTLDQCKKLLKPHMFSVAY